MVFVQKIEIRNHFLHVLVAQDSCKIAPNHLGGDQKHQVLFREFVLFADFKKGIICDQKRKYAIISFAFWSPKAVAKSLQTTLAATSREEGRGEGGSVHPSARRGHLFIHPPTSRSPAPDAATSNHNYNCKCTICLIHKFVSN